MLAILFQRTLGMPDHNQLKRHDNIAASMMCNYMQQINKIAILRDISALLFWKTLGAPDQT